jgi:hypothetical protein
MQGQEEAVQRDQALVERKGELVKRDDSMKWLDDLFDRQNDAIQKTVADKIDEHLTSLKGMVAEVLALVKAQYGEGNA